LLRLLLLVSLMTSPARPPCEAAHGVVYCHLTPVPHGDVADRCFDRLVGMVIGLGQAVDGLVELTGFKLLRPRGALTP